MQDNGISKYIIDLRSAQKYKNGRLRTSVNFPLEDILDCVRHEETNSDESGCETGDMSSWKEVIKRNEHLIKQRLIALVDELCTRVKIGEYGKQEDSELNVMKELVPEQEAVSLLNFLPSLPGLAPRFGSSRSVFHFCVLVDDDGASMENVNWIHDVLERKCYARLFAEWLKIENKAKEIIILNGGYNFFQQKYPFLITTENKKAIQGALASEIIEDFLYLGSYRNATNREELDSIGITHILNMGVELENKYPLCYTYLKLGINDTINDNVYETFDEAIAFIESARTAGGKVLVHCAMGISRSSSVILSYLISNKHNPMLMNDAYQLLKRKRRCINPNPAFLKQLCDYELKIYPHLIESTFDLNGNRK